jgi:glucose/arabinose dehydrogenase
VDHANHSLALNLQLGTISSNVYLQNEDNAQLNNSPTSIVFIDGALANEKELISNIQTDRLIFLNKNSDGVIQIAEYLSKYTELTNIAIFSHGNIGVLEIGNSQLNSDNLQTYASELKIWSNALKEDADIFFYGCNVGQGTAGESFLQEISQLTGADIAASDDPTGNSQQGGNWQLEVKVGEIPSDLNLITGKIELDNGVLVFDRDSSQQSVIELSNNNYTVRERHLDGKVFAQVTILRTGDIEDPVSIDYHTYDTNSAIAGFDYQPTEGTLTFNSGETRKNVSIPIFHDWLAEGNESFSFTIDNPKGATLLAPRTAQIQILNDDYLSNAIGYNGNQYLLTSPNLTWEEAQAEAASLGGNLVTINDGMEQNWLSDTFGKNGEWLWIGLTDKEQEGQFNWVSGQPSNYTNWIVGQPDDWQQSQDYAYLRYGQKWDDAGDSRLRGIIEIGGANEANTIYSTQGNGLRAEYFDNIDYTELKLIRTDPQVNFDWKTGSPARAIGNSTFSVRWTGQIAPKYSEKYTFTTSTDDGVRLWIDDNLIVDRFMLRSNNNNRGEIFLQAGQKYNLKLEYFENLGLASSQLFWSSSSQNLEIVPQDRLYSLDPNLVASWNFNEGNSQKALDLTGNNPGTLLFGTQWLSGKIDEGLRFDGIDNRVEVKSSTSLNITSQITLSAWIKPEAFDDWDGIINKGTQTSPYGLRLWHDGSLRFTANWGDPQDGLGGGSWNSHTKLTLNEWHHVAATYDGNFLRFYIDGWEDANVVSTKMLFGINNEFLNIGAGFPKENEYFQGAIDEVRIYNRSLSQTEIQTLAGKDPLNPPLGEQLVSDTIASGLIVPSAIDWTPDGRLMFIAQKDGIVRVVENGVLKSDLFIDISARVNNNGDRGLLDLAVHPDFENNPYIYLLFTYDPPEVDLYTDNAGRDGSGNRAARLIRLTADINTNYTTAVSGSAVVLLGKNSTWNNYNGFVNSTYDANEPPAGIVNGKNLEDFLNADSQSHTIGSVRFGSDGKLYVSNGDGISFNRVDERAVRVQDIDNLSGKLLRIDPLTGEGLSDNPFYNGDPDSNRSKVYQYGLRNPFRFTIDPRNNRLYVGDVGWTKWEEINSSLPGANFGWPYYEGGNGVSLKNAGYQDLLVAREFYNSGQTVTPALLAISHKTGIDALILGDFYLSNIYPDRYKGDLFFNDLDRGIVQNISFDRQGKISALETFTTGVKYIVQIAIGPDGNLYYVDLDDGSIGRWRFV